MTLDGVDQAPSYAGEDPAGGFAHGGWHTPRMVRALKHEDGPDLRLIGSAQLARTLLDRDLIDEMRLMIDPLLLGAGKRLFTGTIGKVQCET
jgi:dihydrofolate reductase